MLTHEILRPYICCILKETGFHSADYVAVETLTEMFQSCKLMKMFIFKYYIFTTHKILCFATVITEIGKTSRMFSEAAGRVEPLPADVTLALIDIGLSLNGMEQYAFRTNRHSMPPPAQSTQAKQLSMLAAGSKQHLPHYIPNHLPQFPDPHAYTRTPVMYFSQP